MRHNGGFARVAVSSRPAVFSALVARIAAIARSLAWRRRETALISASRPFRRFKAVFLVTLKFNCKKIVEKKFEVSIKKFLPSTFFIKISRKTSARPTNAEANSFRGCSSRCDTSVYGCVSANRSNANSICSHARSILYSVFSGLRQIFGSTLSLNSDTRSGYPF